MTNTGTTLLAEPDADSFRTAMGCLPTGVALLTQGSGDTASVMTLNSLTSVSLDPLLLLVSVGKDGRMRSLVPAGGGFAVNVLAEEHRELSGEFARADRPAGEEAMRRIGAVEGITGNAVVPSAAASFECLLHAEHEAGDHVLFVGRVVAVRHSSCARPLLFHRGRYTSLG
ncbi:flavin reductase family protein [Streptomyces glaucosporus]|uniref:Flavin reductase family protein n=1 Tax=Streptomyces glaucosporus TaxID=284044 RepID=A0ABN3HK59_9ACTN